MNIDWSKAPEGATHYDTRFDLFCNESGYWTDDSIWVRDNYQNEWGTARYIERPAAWNGEGLPPVGTVCEVMDDDAQWNECTVLAHHDGKAVFVDLAGTYGGLDDLCRFRPLRTPEQIAAEERKREIETLSEHIEELLRAYEAKNYYGIAKSLHLAGYRKQEQTK